MLSGLTGWAVIAIGLIVVLVIVAAIVTIVLVAVRTSSAKRQAELQRAYEAGQHSAGGPPAP